MDIKVYQFDHTDKEKDEDSYIKLFAGLEPTQEVLENFYFKMCKVSFENKEFDRLDDLMICEELFTFFNDCHRPNKNFRSMCVNDIVTIDDRMYICRPQSFKQCNYKLTSLPDRSDGCTYTIISRNLL